MGQTVMMTTLPRTELIEASVTSDQLLNLAGAGYLIEMKQMGISWVPTLRRCGFLLPADSSAAQVMHVAIRFAMFDQP